MQLDVQDLGVVRYDEALALQRAVHARVAARQSPSTLLLLEHPPTITLSQRKTAASNLLASPQRLLELGIELHATDRGGDITYHGPGQLVAYPVFHLNDLRLNVGRYMRLLEEATIDTAAQFNISAQRIDKCTGVWINPTPLPQSTPPESSCPTLLKLAALGVRVERGVTLHGLALNVTTDLSHFQTIIPCGLKNRGVTSFRQLLGDRCPSMQQVKHAFAAHFQRHFQARLHQQGFTTEHTEHTEKEP